MSVFVIDLKKLGFSLVELVDVVLDVDDVDVLVLVEVVDVVLVVARENIFHFWRSMMNMMNR